MYVSRFKSPILLIIYLFTPISIREEKLTVKHSFGHKKIIEREFYPRQIKDIESFVTFKLCLTQKI